MWFLFCSLPAVGAGLDSPQVGSVDSGPATADAAALFYNPALLTRVDRPTLMIGAGLVAGRVRYARDRLGTYGFADELVLTAPVDPADLDPTRSGPAPSIGATPVAPFGDVFAAIPVDRVTLGFGAYAPWAVVLSYPDDGDQRFALQDAQVLVGRLAGGAAVDLGPLSLGGHVAAELGAGSLTRVQDLAGLAFFEALFENPAVDQDTDFGPDAPSAVREQDVLGRPVSIRQGFARAVTFGVGAAVTQDRWHVAASYDHGSTLEFRGQFSFDVDDPLFTNDLAPIGLAYPALIEGTGSFSVATPRRVRLGIQHDLGASRALRVGASWSDWSRYDATRLSLVSDGFVQPDLGLGDTVDATIPRRWQSSIAAEVGLAHPNYSVTVGYESPASPSATVDVASVDGHRLVVRGGGRVTLSDRAALWVGGKLQGIWPRTVTTSDFDLGNGRYGLALASLSTHLIYARPSR